jgi:hypothetical protein
MEACMATVSPAGATVERSNLSTVVGVIALLTVIALIYFIARGRGAQPISQPSGLTAPTEQSQPVPPSAPQK